MLLLVAGAVLVRAAFALVTPSFEAPDEPSHFKYVQAILETGSLPVRSSMAPYTDGTYEYIHAPLTYLLMAGFVKAFGLTEHPPAAVVLLLRLAFTLPAALLVIITYAFGCLFFPRDSAPPVAMASVAAFLPSLAYTTAMVNNDGGVTLFGAAALYCMARALVRGEVDGPTSALVASSLALAVYCKMTAILLFVVAVGWCGLLWRLTGAPRSAFRAACGVAVAGLACTPLLLRNLALYGDPLAAETGLQWARGHLPLIDAVGQSALYFHDSLWGVFGQFTELNVRWGSPVTRSAKLADIVTVLTGVALTGLLLSLMRGGWRRRTSGERAALLLSGGACLLFTVVPLALGVRMGSGGATARYAFPCIPAWALLLVCGLRTWTRDTALLLLPLFLLAADVYYIVRILRPYYVDFRPVNL